MRPDNKTVPLVIMTHLAVEAELAAAAWERSISSMSSRRRAFAWEWRIDPSVLIPCLGGRLHDACEVRDRDSGRCGRRAARIARRQDGAPGRPTFRRWTGWRRGDRGPIAQRARPVSSRQRRGHAEPLRLRPRARITPAELRSKPPPWAWCSGPTTGPSAATS